MTNVAKDKKISSFLAQAALPSDAYLIYISANTNYKISLADFQASLGVTGTIVQDGAVTGTPVLNTVGSVNNIRNLEAGSGIRTAVSPENGITIEHNFTEDTVGVELVEDLTVSQPKFRSLVPGSGINISGSGGEIQIALSAIPASTKTVIVNSITDFPAAVAGVITLLDDTEYAVRNDISTTNRFVMGNNTVISGSDNAVVALTYTGAGVMFSSVNDTWAIKDIALNCTAGTLLDFNGSGVELLQLLNVQINAATLGTIDDIAGLYFSGNQYIVTTDGLTFGGSNGVVLVENAYATINAGEFFDLAVATFDGFSITDGFYTLNGAGVKFLKGAASSANLNAGALGSVHNCRFFGAGTPLDTITTSDTQWQFYTNDTIEDTTYDALISMIGNATATVITVAGTAVLIAGAWTEEHIDKFTTTAAGRMTYIGEKDLEIDINGAFTLEPVSGTNKDLAVYVYKNGVEVTNSKSGAIVSNGAKLRIPLVWRLTVSKNDYIEFWVENNSDTVNVTVIDAAARVS